MPGNDPHSDDPSNRQQLESGSSTEQGADERSSDQSDDWVDDWQPVPEKVRVDARQAAVGGALAAVVSLVGEWIVGQTSGAEARVLLETSLTTTRSFCGTLTLALGNILALMLTLLSLSASTDIELEWAHYQRVKQIAWVDTVSVVGATLIYLLLNVPPGGIRQSGRVDTGIRDPLLRDARSLVPVGRCVHYRRTDALQHIARHHSRHWPEGVRPLDAF